MQPCHQFTCSYFQKDEVKPSVQTQVTIRDQAVAFWKVTVLADGKANLQSSWGGCGIASNLRHTFFPIVTALRVRCGLLSKVPDDHFLTTSSHIVAVACTCLNVKSTSIKTCTAIAEHPAGVGARRRGNLWSAALPKRRLEAGQLSLIAKPAGEPQTNGFQFLCG